MMRASRLSLALGLLRVSASALAETVIVPVRAGTLTEVFLAPQPKHR